MRDRLVRGARRTASEPRGAFLAAYEPVAVQVVQQPRWARLSHCPCILDTVHVCGALTARAIRD